MRCCRNVILLHGLHPCAIAVSILGVETGAAQAQACWDAIILHRHEWGNIFCCCYRCSLCCCAIPPCKWDQPCQPAGLQGIIHRQAEQ
jgi:hypothetical protein